MAYKCCAERPGQSQSRPKAGTRRTTMWICKALLIDEVNLAEHLGYLGLTRRSLAHRDWRQHIARYDVRDCSYHSYQILLLRSRESSSTSLHCRSHKPVSASSGQLCWWCPFRTVCSVEVGFRGERAECRALEKKATTTRSSRCQKIEVLVCIKATRFSESHTWIRPSKALSASQLTIR